MTLASMTGFTRRGGETGPFRWNWEIKSVNNKGLEVRTKIPGFLDGFDIEIKKKISAVLNRGSVFLNLQVDRAVDGERFVVNESRLADLIEIAARYSDQPGVVPASVDGLLAIKGVVDLVSDEPADDELASLKAALLTDLKLLITDLVAARRDEGRRMEVFLAKQLETMHDLLAAAKVAVGDRGVAMHERFIAQLRKLEQSDKPVSDERLAQEIAVMAVKADIQEEFDRLESHFGEAATLLAAEKPVGRRLDFLCQEFNREANTLCSKSGDTQLTKIGVDLKVLIDQFREQVQNIE